jgi:ParB/RepB/Spo0J family partition protein
MPRTQSRPARVKPPPIIQVPLARLEPTPDNRRRHISNLSVESLAKSMKHDGVLQPIVVRPHPSKKGMFEIRAGERRWRAAKLAGLTHLPAIVRALDDPSALSVTIAENMQRQDPLPLEEAATIQQAFDRGYDIKAIAAKLGKTVQYVARRASLTRLTKAWTTEIFRESSDASQLSVAHLELIARLPEETQEILASDDFAIVFGRGFPTVEELRRLIDGNTHTLRTMAWPLDDETLDPKAGSCRNCPKRSSCSPMLFDGEEVSDNGKVSKTDRCLDPQCFERKQTAWVQRRETELRQQHPNLQLVQVGYSRLSEAADQAFGERITRLYAPAYVTASDKRATPAMQIDGPKAGQLVHLNLGGSEATNGHVKKQRPRDGEGKVIPLTLDERKARLQKRRNALIVKNVTERLRAFTLDDAKTAVDHMPPFVPKDGSLPEISSLVLAFGTPTRADRPYDDGEPWKEYDRIRKLEANSRLAHALLGVTQVWLRRMGSSNNHVVNTQAHDAKRLCEILRWDFAAIESESITAIPEPKSWASLRPADGPPLKKDAESKPVRKRHARSDSGRRSSRAIRSRRKRQSA